jgi:hypothetical protein
MPPYERIYKYACRFYAVAGGKISNIKDSITAYLGIVSAYAEVIQKFMYAVQKISNDVQEKVKGTKNKSM